VKTNSINDVYKEVGERIVTARRKLDMSQEQLAASSGIDRSHMGFH